MITLNLAEVVDAARPRDTVAEMADAIDLVTVGICQDLEDLSQATQLSAADRKTIARAMDLVTLLARQVHLLNQLRAAGE